MLKVVCPVLSCLIVINVHCVFTSKDTVDSQQNHSWLNANYKLNHGEIQFKYFNINSVIISFLHICHYHTNSIEIQEYYTNSQFQYLTIPKTTRNSCCINLDHTGSEGAQATILGYHIYQTLKLLITHVVLTLVTLDQLVYNSQSLVTIFLKL